MGSSRYQELTRVSITVTCDWRIWIFWYHFAICLSISGQILVSREPSSHSTRLMFTDRTLQHPVTSIDWNHQFQPHRPNWLLGVLPDLYYSVASSISRLGSLLGSPPWVTITHQLFHFAHTHGVTISDIRFPVLPCLEVGQFTKSSIGLNHRHNRSIGR